MVKPNRSLVVKLHIVMVHWPPWLSEPLTWPLPLVESTETGNMPTTMLMVARRRKYKRRRLLLFAAAYWYLFMRRKPRSVWTKPWLLRRPALGAYDTLLSELREEDTTSYLNFLRVSPEIFDDLLHKVTPFIERQNTVFRQAISPGMRLAITLRYLATGKSLVCMWVL
jgi:hypothetical protein